MCNSLKLTFPNTLINLNLLHSIIVYNLFCLNYVVVPILRAKLFEAHCMVELCGCQPGTNHTVWQSSVVVNLVPTTLYDIALWLSTWSLPHCMIQLCGCQPCLYHTVRYSSVVINLVPTTLYDIALWLSTWSLPHCIIQLYGCKPGYYQTVRQRALWLSTRCSIAHYIKSIQISHLYNICISKFNLKYYKEIGLSYRAVGDFVRTIVQALYIQSVYLV